MNVIVVRPSFIIVALSVNQDDGMTEILLGYEYWVCTYYSSSTYCVSECNLLMHWYTGDCGNLIGLDSNSNDYRDEPSPWDSKDEAAWKLIAKEILGVNVLCEDDVIGPSNDAGVPENVCNHNHNKFGSLVHCLLQDVQTKEAVT